MKDSIRPSASEPGLASASASAAALAVFGLTSAWVAGTHRLPVFLAGLWLAAGLFAALGALPCLHWGVSLMRRRHGLAGLSAVATAVAAPAWFVYGLVAATAAP